MKDIVIADYLKFLCDNPLVGISGFYLLINCLFFAVLMYYVFKANGLWAHCLCICHGNGNLKAAMNVLFILITDKGMLFLITIVCSCLNGS